MPKEFSQGQMMSLVMLERAGLMCQKHICTTFDVPTVCFDIWSRLYVGHAFFDSKYVQKLTDDNRRLRNLAKARAKRQAGAKPKYSEAKIDCLLLMIASGLGTADQVCNIFSIPKTKLDQWSNSMSQR